MLSGTNDYGYYGYWSTTGAANNYTIDGTTCTISASATTATDTIIINTNASWCSSSTIVIKFDDFKYATPPPPKPWMHQLWDKVPGFGRNGQRALSNEDRCVENSFVRKPKTFIKPFRQEYNARFLDSPNPCKEIALDEEYCAIGFEAPAFGMKQRALA